MQITTKLNKTQVINTLNATIKGLQDFTNPLTKTRDYMAGYIRAQFATEGAMYGPKWKQLAPWTQSERDYKGYMPKHPILERTGKLKNSFKYNLTKNSLKVTNPVQYFPLHQLGGINKMGLRVPQRRMMEINQQNIEKIKSIFGDFIVKTIKNALT